ncbi:hypothetical protein WA026_011004 [Henosepilachna vigintioctopunctata]|uniref:Uncharacterized protein n=1 Tax=Henosepilachna vigintioctopunctata TaxID=420089 RepID=A0AAW1V063_9CUCU
MEIPKIELVSKNSNENYISTENIFGSSLDLEASDLSFESRLSLDLKSREPAGDGEKDNTRESVSTLRLSIGCHELNILAQESEVYFQKITASVVFSEDYKCRIRRKKCESDCQIKNIFGEKDEKYARLIAEAKKRQRCGPCLTRDECNCGDANVLPVIETRISAKPRLWKLLWQSQVHQR